jgi:hypothetical protein
MKKIKLDLDDLKVESFDTTPEGTVYGYGTCPTFCGTCAGQATCDSTCYASCGGTCDTCPATGCSCPVRECNETCCATCPA